MIWILPGFLGQPEEFSFFKAPHKVVPLFEKNHVLSLKETKQEWIAQFIDHVKSANSKKNTLIGYSFGARLCLEVISSDPDIFENYFLLSCNPTTLDDEQKQLRKKADQNWCDRFLNHRWDKTLTAWNQQSVLSHSKAVDKERAYYCLSAIKWALTKYSLAEQNIDPKVLNTVNTKLLWVFGERDEKYVNIARKMQQQGWAGEYRLIENAGHRIHLDNPEGFLKCMSDFLANKIDLL